MLGACDPAPPPTAAPSPTPSVTPSETPPPRKTPAVVLEAAPPTRARLATAVRDLKAVDVWDRLAGHLYLIELDSRAGSANEPEDGHLADAYFTGVVDDRGGGAVCDIMFFPTAVAADLARWRDYFAQGLLSESAPSVRAFYGSLLAHELAHCRRGPRGESVARAWENRVRAALRAAGI